MEKITIRHLNEVPELIPEVAHWIYKAFWEHKGFPNAQFLVEKLREANSNSKIPLSLAAFSDGIPVGTVNLIENDDEERPHLKPWLAALWVNPAFRKQGIGSSLVQSLLEESKRLRIETLYLETHSPDFYMKLGAVVIEEISPDFFLMAFQIN